MNVRIIAATLIVCCVSAEDPYQTWAQGRPAEALPGLLAAAQASDAPWQRWYDLGLAAHAAGQPGLAVAALLTAQQRAPWASEPRLALRQTGTPLPAAAMDVLGPLPALALSWPGLVLAGTAGALLGWALYRRRVLPGLGAGLLLLLLAPGLVLACWPGPAWCTVLGDSTLVDSTGAPQRGGELAPGTLLRREPREPWAGRVLVTTPDGRSGWVAESDTAVRLPLPADP